MTTSPLPSWNTTRKVIVAGSWQPLSRETWRHSATSLRFGAAPVTFQNAFWSVFGMGSKSSQNGATIYQSGQPTIR
jgi:hypothetical protein